MKPNPDQIRPGEPIAMWLGRCPTCEEDGALVLRSLPDGRSLFWCIRGCPVKEMLEPLGLVEWASANRLPAKLPPSDAALAIKHEIAAVGAIVDDVLARGAVKPSYQSRLTEAAQRVSRLVDP